MRFVTQTVYAKKYWPLSGLLRLATYVDITRTLTPSVVTSLWHGTFAAGGGGGGSGREFEGGAGRRSLAIPSEIFEYALEAHAQLGDHEAASAVRSLQAAQRF